MECGICYDWIDDKYGNNAKPLFDGKCCNTCNLIYVIPIRMELMSESILS